MHFNRVFWTGCFHPEHRLGVWEFQTPTWTCDGGSSTFGPLSDLIVQTGPYSGNAGWRVGLEMKEAGGESSLAKCNKVDSKSARDVR